MKSLACLIALAVATSSAVADLPLELPPPGPLSSGSFYETLHFSFADIASVVEGADNPFPAPATRAIHVVNDMSAGESQFRFRGRFSSGDGPLRGKMEIPLRLVEGGLQIDFGSNPEAFVPGGPKTLLLEGEQIYCSLNLLVGEAPRFSVAGRHHKGTADGAEILDANTVYVIRFEWDFSPEQFHFRVLINGAPLRSAVADHDVWVRTERMDSWRGPNAFGIYSKANLRSDYFIGPITPTSEN